MVAPCTKNQPADLNKVVDSNCNLVVVTCGLHQAILFDHLMSYNELYMSYAYSAQNSENIAFWEICVIKSIIEDKTMPWIKKYKSSFADKENKYKLLSWPVHQNNNM